MKSIKSLNFSNQFINLDPQFFQAKTPDPVAEPYLVNFNPEVAELLDLDPKEADGPDFSNFLSGNKPINGAQPLAMAYTGHQFGVYNPRLGDGRGLLLGEIVNQKSERWDLYLKGSGPTRFARGFDGRATLRSSIREYLAGEALHGLNVPTTRALAIIGIRDLIYRETPELAAVLVRVADCHVRFGSFEMFHYNNQPENVTKLADFVIETYYPELAPEPDKYRLFYREAIRKTAYLIACWQAVGFIHGVMNTDNMSITGATFDFGPYGFMDRFNPRFTPNHSDGAGRYAYGAQPEIGFWNLKKLGMTLGHLMDSETIAEALETYQPAYNKFYRSFMAEKLGLEILDSEFKQLTGDLFQLLYDNAVDYANFFRRLSHFPHGPTEELRKSFVELKKLDHWLERYRKLIEREGAADEERKENMDRVNPKFILRNYLMAEAIDKALKESDFSEIERLRVLLRDPFRDRPEQFETLGIDANRYASDTPDSLREMRLSCSA